MSDPTKPSLSLLSKLGSIVVHADEALSVDGRHVDIQMTVSLIDDPEVQQWIKDMGPLLPLKRKSKP
jgi:hypothetical protein